MATHKTDNSNVLAMDLSQSCTIDTTQDFILKLTDPWEKWLQFLHCNFMSMTQRKTLVTPVLCNFMSMIWHKTVATIVHEQWSYFSLVLSQPCMFLWLISK